MKYIPCPLFLRYRLRPEDFFPESQWLPLRTGEGGIELSYYHRTYAIMEWYLPRGESSSLLINNGNLHGW